MGNKRQLSFTDRASWIADRKRFLTQVQNQVWHQTGEGRVVSAYVREYNREFTGHWRATSYLELIKAIHRAHLVFGSDFHAFSQSQRAHIRILRQLPQNRHVVLALECFEFEHQHWLDQYVSGRLSDKQLIAAVDWHRRWQFPFEFYRPFLQLAMERKYQVLGINKWLESRSEQSLRRRDKFAAEIIGRELQKNPDHLIYVIFGDFHQATTHLPRAVARQTRDLRQVVLFQNHETLYFQFAKRKHGTIPEVLRGPGDRFCLLTSPPWVKWQSYLMYLEHTFDRDLENPEIDLTDQVLALARLLAADLKFKIKEGELEVDSTESVHFLKRIDRALSAGEKKAVHLMIKDQRSFLLPSVQTGFLSRLSVNHAASLAGQFVHGQLSSRNLNLLKMPDCFLQQVWLEAVGFFLSKLINPRRKSETLQSLQLKTHSVAEKQARKAALQRALDQRVSEMVAINLGRRRPLAVKKIVLRDELEGAKILGHMLGERMFQKFESGELTFEAFKKLLKQPVENVGFADFYYQIIRCFEQERKE